MLVSAENEDMGRSVEDVLRLTEDQEKKAGSVRGGAYIGTMNTLRQKWQVHYLGVDWGELSRYLEEGGAAVYPHGKNGSRVLVNTEKWSSPDHSKIVLAHEVVHAVFTGAEAVVKLAELGLAEELRKYFKNGVNWTHHLGVVYELREASRRGCLSEHLKLLHETALGVETLKSGEDFEQRFRNNIVERLKLKVV